MQKVPDGINSVVSALSVQGTRHPAQTALYETSNQDTYLQLVPAPPKVLQKFLFRNINPDAVRKEELGSVRS